MLNQGDALYVINHKIAFHPGSGGRYPGETFWTGACAQGYHVLKKMHLTKVIYNCPRFKSCCLIWLVIPSSMYATL